MEIDAKQIQDDIFKATPKQLVADIIAANHASARITDTLIETYMSLAMTKQFTLDKTICEIRSLNCFDNVFTFILDDESKVVLNKQLYDKMCESINNNDTVQFMRKNTENFIAVVNIIKEHVDA